MRGVVPAHPAARGDHGGRLLRQDEHALGHAHQGAAARRVGAGDGEQGADDEALTRCQGARGGEDDAGPAIPSPFPPGARIRLPSVGTPESLHPIALP